jgi:hypothetical protein
MILILSEPQVKIDVRKVSVNFQSPVLYFFLTLIYYWIFLRYYPSFSWFFTPIFMNSLRSSLRKQPNAQRVSYWSEELPLLAIGFNGNSDARSFCGWLKMAAPCLLVRGVTSMKSYSSYMLWRRSNHSLCNWRKDYKAGVHCWKLRLGLP